jgi:hypothetical protein
MRFEELNYRASQLNEVLNNHYTLFPNDDLSMLEDRVDGTLDLVQDELGCLKNEIFLFRVINSIEKHCSALETLDAIIIDARKLAYINILAGIIIYEEGANLATALMETYFFEEMIQNHYLESLDYVALALGNEPVVKPVPDDLLLKSRLYVGEFNYLICDFFVAHEFSHLYLSRGVFAAGFQDAAINMVKSLAANIAVEMSRLGVLDDPQKNYRFDDGTVSLAPRIRPSKWHVLIAIQSPSLGPRLLTEVSCDLFALFVFVIRATREERSFGDAIALAPILLAALEAYSETWLGANVVRERLPWQIDELSGSLKEVRKFLRSNFLDIMIPLFESSPMVELDHPLDVSKYIVQQLRIEQNMSTYLLEPIVRSGGSCSRAFVEHRGKSYEMRNGRLRRKSRIPKSEKPTYLGRYDYVSNLLGANPTDGEATNSKE